MMERPNKRGVTAQLLKDNKSKFPDNNFSDVVPKQTHQLASKGKIVKNLVIQASTTDITNTKHVSRGRSKPSALPP